MNRQDANEVFISIAFHIQRDHIIVPHTNNEISLSKRACQTHYWLNACNIHMTSILMWKVTVTLLSFSLIRPWNHSIRVNINEASQDYFFHVIPVTVCP